MTEHYDNKFDDLKRQINVLKGEVQNAKSEAFKAKDAVYLLHNELDNRRKLEYEKATDELF